MKKSFYLLALVIAAVACAREPMAPETIDPEKGLADGELIEVTLVTGSPATRTELGYNESTGKLFPLWSGNDKIGLTSVPDSAEEEEDEPNYKFTNTSASASMTAEFTGQLHPNDTYFAYYPYTPYTGYSDSDSYLYCGYGSFSYTDLVFYLPSEQYPSPTSFDEKADLMISNPFYVDQTTTTVNNLEFTRVNAIVKVVLEDLTSGGILDGESVHSIMLGEYPSDEGYMEEKKASSSTSKSPRTRADFEGYFEGYYGYGPAGFTGWADYEMTLLGDEYVWRLYDSWDQEPYVIASYSSIDDGGKGFYHIGAPGEAAYFIVFPVLVKNDNHWVGSLPITIETENYVIRRRIYLPDDGIALQPSRVTTLNIGLSDDVHSEYNSQIVEKKIEFEKSETTLLLGSDYFGFETVSLITTAFDWEDVDLNDVAWSLSTKGIVDVSIDDAYVDGKYQGEGSCLSGIYIEAEQVGTTTLTVTYRGMTASIAIEVISESRNITFVDPLVEEICVAQWDVDEDGNLSEFEASKVGALTNYRTGDGIRLVFVGTSIQSFDELQYFTGLETLENAFSNCSSLQSVQIPSTFKGDISWAFYQCENLVSVGDLPEGMTEIGYCAFSGCKKLSGITLPSTIVTIGSSAFYDCELLSITLPESLKSIGDSAFRNCKSLQSVSIPGGVSVIAQNTFMNCTSLTSVTLSEGLGGINENAFYNCGMHEITFPSTLEWVNTNSFARVPFLSGHDGYNGITFLGTTPPSIYTRDYENSGNYTTFTGRHWNPELNEGAGDWTYGIQINVPAASLDAYSTLSAIQNGGQNIIVGF